MCEKLSNSDFEAVIGRLKKSEKLLITTHARPDGDALGSLAALGDGAAEAGKSVRLLVPDKLPKRYEYLFPDGNVAGPDDFAKLADWADTIVIVDTCSGKQLDGLTEQLAAWRGKILVVDHHRNPDDLADLQWIDPSAAAAGMMVDRIINALDWPISKLTAEALMTAVTTDTGWLRFANADSDALRAVARYVSAGVRPDKLYRKLFQADRPERLKLISRLLEGMELYCDGRLAIMTIGKKDFQATGAVPQETENLVNEALRLATVDTAVIFIENTDCVRVSFRSRDAIDVAELASQFGGGGHRRAAGLRMTEPLEAIKPRIISACIEALNGGKV